MGLVLTAIAGSGIMFIQSESSIKNLWVPQSSQIYNQYTTQETYFGSYAEGLALLLKGHNGGNIMTPNGLTQANEAMTRISNIAAQCNGNTYTFTDVCARVDISSTNCVADQVNLHSIFFSKNDAYWNNQQYIDNVLNTNGIEHFVGSLQYDNTANVVIGANVIRIYWELTTTTNPDFSQALIEYQRAFANYWQIHKNDYSEFEVIFVTDYSLNDEMNRTIRQDARLFAIAFGVMLVYLQITLGSFTCIGARALLATSSIFILICALIFGFGVSAYLGMKFSTLVFVVPFLLLGVGVDDMIIIVDTLKHTKLPNNDEEFRAKQLGLALQHSGVAISLTSFCSIIAFFGGTITDLPGLQYFCFYAAFSFLGNYILQFCLFVPLLVLDNKRIGSNRNFCCPCYTHNAQEPASINEDDDDNDNETGILNWILNNSLIKILSNMCGRTCIIITFLVLIGFSGYFATKVKALSDPALLVPDDSYTITYYDLTAVAWAGTSPAEIQIIFIDTDFSDAMVRRNVYSLMSKVENLTDTQGEVENWLEPFTVYLTNTKGVDIDSITDEATFYRYLKDFETDSNYIHWDDELIFDDDINPSKVIATKFYFSAMEPRDSVKRYQSYLFYNDLMIEVMGKDTQSFMMSTNWIYGYFDDALKGYTLNNLIASSIAVLLILILLMDIRLAAFIMLIIVLIDICLFGWMYMVGIDLQTISFCQLCMAVGLTVDYVIHMVHAVAEMKLNRNDNNNNNNNNKYSQRIKVAMIETGWSVIKGALTTFIGASVLAFAASVAFRSFFYMLAGIIIVATFFGLLFAPALMGQFPFIYSGLDEIQSQNQQENDILEYQGVAVTENDSHDDTI